VKNLGSRGYCAAHLADFYRRCISPETWAWRGAGLGLPITPIDDEGFAILECSACRATWAGAPFTDCSWCIEAAARQRQWQAELVLQPPGIIGGMANREYPGVMSGWADRLANAVKAGLISRQQAERAWRRAVTHAA
jgi:hypothetical protein